jgi:hypothetical protein
MRESHDTEVARVRKFAAAVLARDPALKPVVAEYGLIAQDLLFLEDHDHRRVGVYFVHGNISLRSALDGPVILLHKHDKDQAKQHKHQIPIDDPTRIELLDILNGPAFQCK